MFRLSDYDYELPDRLIAQTPLAERTDSRLLHMDRHSGVLEDRSFRDLSQILKPDDLLILNNTRVTALRLKGKKMTGGAVEALLLREARPRGFQALVRPAKRLTVGTRLVFDQDLEATVTETLAGGHRLIEFDPTENFAERLGLVATIPLPPYIHEHLHDPERYQTVIASAGGSAAAPTAALHFSREYLDELTATGIETAAVTLDVGIDTFRPVQTEDLSQHVMHGERCTVPPETAHKVEACRGRIIAVGTTTVRTLETFACGKRRLGIGSQVSKLFIQPGFEYQIADGMLTNFHMPKTTMLIMVSAMSSRERVLRAYDHAVRTNYRFLSFGDSMLIL